MEVSRLRAVVLAVLMLGFLQIFFEDIIMYFATTGIAPPALLNSPLAMIAVPLLISALLLILLVGGAITHAESLR